MYLDKKCKQRTTTISNSNNLIWNERFTFNLQKDDDTIHFGVYNADVVDQDSVGNGKVK
jgi:Ca2+-dependent lipid-binding protein